MKQQMTTHTTITAAAGLPEYQFSATNDAKWECLEHVCYQVMKEPYVWFRLRQEAQQGQSVVQLMEAVGCLDALGNEHIQEQAHRLAAAITSNPHYSNLDKAEAVCILLRLVYNRYLSGTHSIGSSSGGSSGSSSGSSGGSGSGSSSGSGSQCLEGWAELLLSTSTAVKQLLPAHIWALLLQPGIAMQLTDQQKAELLRWMGVSGGFAECTTYAQLLGLMGVLQGSAKDTHLQLRQEAYSQLSTQLQQCDLVGAAQLLQAAEVLGPPSLRTVSALCLAINSLLDSNQLKTSADLRVYLSVVALLDVWAPAAASAMPEQQGTDMPAAAAVLPCREAASGNPASQMQLPAIHAQIAAMVVAESVEMLAESCGFLWSDVDCTWHHQSQEQSPPEDSYTKQQVQDLCIKAAQDDMAAADFREALVLHMWQSKQQDGKVMLSEEERLELLTCLCVTTAHGASSVQDVAAVIDCCVAAKALATGIATTPHPPVLTAWLKGMEHTLTNLLHEGLAADLDVCVQAGKQVLAGPAYLPEYNTEHVFMGDSVACIGSWVMLGGGTLLLGQLPRWALVTAAAAGGGQQAAMADLLWGLCAVWDPTVGDHLEPVLPQQVQQLHSAFVDTDYALQSLIQLAAAACQLRQLCTACPDGKGFLHQLADIASRAVFDSIAGSSRGWLAEQDAVYWVRDYSTQEGKADKARAIWGMVQVLCSLILRLLPDVPPSAATAETDSMQLLLDEMEVLMQATGDDDEPVSSTAGAADSGIASPSSTAAAAAAAHHRPPPCSIVHQCRSALAALKARV